MEEVIERINELKTIIEDIKTKKAQAEGKKQSLIERLNKLGISPEEAEKEIKKLNERKKKIQEKINEKFNALQELYEW